MITFLEWGNEQYPGKYFLQIWFGNKSRTRGGKWIENYENQCYGKTWGGKSLVHFKSRIIN